MRTPSEGKPARKASSVRHTRAIQRDRRRHPPSAPPPAEGTARLTELVYPVARNTLSEFRRRGLRERVLTLPVMVALVLALIWRQLSGVAELARLVQQELVCFGSRPFGSRPKPWSSACAACLPSCSTRSLSGCCPTSMRGGHNANGPCLPSSPGVRPVQSGAGL